MYVYCPVGERQQHLVILKDTSRGTSPLKLGTLMALNSIVNNIKPLTFHHQLALGMATRTAARRTQVCHDWAIKGCKVQPVFQFSPALRK